MSAPLVVHASPVAAVPLSQWHVFSVQVSDERGVEVRQGEGSAAEGCPGGVSGGGVVGYLWKGPGGVRSVLGGVWIVRRTGAASGEIYSRGAHEALNARASRLVLGAAAELVASRRLPGEDLARAAVRVADVALPRHRARDVGRRLLACLPGHAAFVGVGWRRVIAVPALALPELTPGG